MFDQQCHLLVSNQRHLTLNILPKKILKIHKIMLLHYQLRVFIIFSIHHLQGQVPVCPVFTILKRYLTRVVDQWLAIGQFNNGCNTPK